ncbi:PD-(D/E)XK nuclease family protein [Desulfovibrio sp.]|uniref:PD-(D/E)XK nuclease family protein n=1 Tax=Desulfovibrio sp. TaxID=885 RepID=UPI0023CC41D5|nr:PD-(D/E)XK nuclease family protein [Desulfovibrio sp.]MDE7241658.1 PD-(D/E)XK nuclease family protein [Desulfovibrio sp.]
MSAQPFLIFPWQRPFLPDLMDAVERLAGGQPGNALIVVPHQRPWRYIVRIFAERGYSGLLPKTVPFGDLVALWRAPEAGSARMVANPLDQGALLHQCVRGLAREDANLEARFARMDMARFLPWGLRLAAVLEELFIQGREPADLAHLEGEVSSPAAALLGALGRISRAWGAALEERGWTTPGLEQFLAARDAARIPERLHPGEDRPVFIAGFSVLSGTEETLLRALWRAGAHVCLHTDPALADAGTAHWACAEQAQWLRNWGARAEPAVLLTEAEAQHKPQRQFFAGYDLHSQLEALAGDLARGDGASTAVVLTDSALLLPVLHHLPEKDVNVSMGYPLARSPLFRLVDDLFRLQEGRAEDGRYHWRALLHVLRHPYLNMLEIPGMDGEPLALRDGLRRMEALIREGSRYVDLGVCLAECRANVSQPLGDLLAECLETTIGGLARADTTAALAGWLGGIQAFLLAHGGDIWRRFPLDAEALFRLMRHVAPQLARNALAGEVFPAPLLFAIARQLLERERIPFEADPLVGVQVLGMLETRLLHFDRVFVVDATDDVLPGNPAQDPLLPDSLRAVLGLPDARRRERVAAHTLHRLCASARETHFYWQEGVSHSALFDGKKLRSRFVEGFLWEEEQAQKHLLVPGTAPLRTAVCEVRQTPREPVALTRTPRLHAAMTAFLQGPISASRLDTYLHCPLRFVWENLCRLKPRREVNEGDDPAAVGICLHAALRALYEPWLGKDVRRGDITAARAQACFEAAFADADLRGLLPADACLMLEAAVPVRLGEFLKHQPEETHIVALEKRIDAELSLAGRAYDFTGIIDRLDRRDGLLHVLDYKTGGIKAHDYSLWSDTAFFAEAAAVCALADEADSGAPSDDAAVERLDPAFVALRERLPSVQLPAYVAMLEAHEPGKVGDAALVELRFKGEERPLFDGLLDDELYAAREDCKLALALLLRHMERAPRFEGRVEDHCSWCPFASLCGS